MMHFVLKMMHFLLEMIHFVLKMMNLVTAERSMRPAASLSESCLSALI